VSWEILLLGLFGVAGWYWYAGMHAREQAIAVGRRACQDASLQFLDESVALRKVSLRAQRRRSAAVPARLPFRVFRYGQ